MTAPPPFGRETIEEILPHPPPFLLVDEVVELDPGARVVALKRVTDEDCAGHFPGNPIMPGVKNRTAGGSRSSPASTASASSASSVPATS